MPERQLRDLDARLGTWLLRQRDHRCTGRRLSAADQMDGDLKCVTVLSFTFDILARWTFRRDSHA